MTSPKNGERVSFGSFTENLEAVELISGADAATTTGLIKGLVHTADVVVLLEAGEVADTANDATPAGVTYMSETEEEGAVEELRWEADTARGEAAIVKAS